MSDSQSKKNILDESKINSQSFIYDWIVLLLISLLVFVIVIPPVIWNEEESKIFEARERMLDLAYALKTYHHLTGEYTDDEELLFETIMQVRDSLIANPRLSGAKDIHLSCIYEISSIGDTINTFPPELINLSHIDSKNRLEYIDKIIYDLKSQDIYNGVRIYEVEGIDDIKNIPDSVFLFIEDYSIETNKLISKRLVDKWNRMDKLISQDSDTTYNQIYSKLIKDPFESDEFNKDKFNQDEIDFYYDINLILKSDLSASKSKTVKLNEMTVSLDKIDSIYNDSKLIRFERESCAETISIDVPRNFGLMLDTLFSASSIISENVVDTIYTLKEPIDGDINNLQTSYVKNQYLFNYVPKNEYDSLWNFGQPLSDSQMAISADIANEHPSDSLLQLFNSATIDLVHLNKMISDTTYNVTYIDNEEFSLDIEVESSNHLIRDLLGMEIWMVIQENMIDCADYRSELSCIEQEKCDWNEEEVCVEIINEIEEEIFEDNLSEDSEDFVSDDEWAALFEEFDNEMQNEIEFGDSLKVSYDFQSRFISNCEIINRTINIEDYDRKRYNLNEEYLKSPINGEKYEIVLFGNNKYDKGEEFIDDNKNDKWDDGEFFIDKKNYGYEIISPIDDNYSESRFLIFSFSPGSPGSIKGNNDSDDRVTWEKKPKWDFPTY